MWGFIEKAVSNISEIVAPITHTNQLYLAIQNNSNGEAKFLIDMNSSEFNIHGLMANSGHGAVHIACRFNNKEVLDALTNKGVSIDLLDSTGNTALHYAAKYGHVEMCKYLIDQGAMKQVVAINRDGRTPYDSTDSHSVRQYLLPLKFKAEAEANAAAAANGGSTQWGNEINHYAANIQTRDPNIVVEPPAPPPIASQDIDYGGGNPYAAQQGSLQHPSYAEYSNPYAQQQQQQQQNYYTQQQPQQQPVQTQMAPPPVDGNPYAAVPAPTAPVVQAPAPVVSVPAAVVQAPAPVVSVPAPVVQAPTPVVSVPAPVEQVPSTQPAPVSKPTMSPPGGPFATGARPVFVSHSPIKPVIPKTTVPVQVSAPAAPTNIYAAAPSVTAPFVRAPPIVTAAPVQHSQPPVAPSNDGYAPGGGGDSRFNNRGAKGRIVPDGFHSSSNDPALQARYGHQIAQRNLPPPPIFGAVGGNAASPPQMNSNTAGPPQMNSNTAGPPQMNSNAAGPPSASLRSHGSGNNLVSSGAVPTSQPPSLATRHTVPAPVVPQGTTVPSLQAPPPPTVVNTHGPPSITPAVGSSSAPKVVYDQEVSLSSTSSSVM